jgi:hypothetical protein
MAQPSNSPSSGGAAAATLAASAAAAADPLALTPDGSAADPAAFQSAVRADADKMAQLEADHDLKGVLLGGDIPAMQALLREAFKVRGCCVPRGALATAAAAFPLLAAARQRQRSLLPASVHTPFRLSQSRPPVSAPAANRSSWRGPKTRAAGWLSAPSTRSGRPPRWVDRCALVGSICRGYRCWVLVACLSQTSWRDYTFRPGGVAALSTICC